MLIVKGPKCATFAAGMKDKIFQFTPSTWYGKLISILSPVVGQDIYDVGKSIADLGKTDKSWGWVQAVGKAQDREGAEKAERLPLKCVVTGAGKQCGVV